MCSGLSKVLVAIATVSTLQSHVKTECSARLLGGRFNCCLGYEPLAHYDVYLYKCLDHNKQQYINTVTYLLVTQETRGVPRTHTPR